MWLAVILCKLLPPITGVFFAWARATAEQAICMEAHHKVCLHQNSASKSYHRNYFAYRSWRMCLWFNKMCTLGSRGYCFLLDTDGSQRSRVNEARSAEKKELLISTVSTVFVLGISRTDFWSQGTKCLVCKKNSNMISTNSKRSRPVLTYHELLSNFIFPLVLDNSARICSACRIALTSSKSKQSAETFNFIALKWKRNTNIKKISLQISANGFEERKSPCSVQQWI